MPYAIIDETQAELRRLEELNIIQKSRSDYTSLGFPILKRNNTIRLVIDSRQLNSITHEDPFPFPSLHDTIGSLKHSHYFSALDLNMGYYQVPMDPASIHLTAFVILGEQYDFLRMPFGLKNTPRTFQRVVK